MRVLLTGADGFVGRHLTPALKARGHAVLALTGPSASDGHAVDLLNMDALKREVGDFRPEVVLHLAAQSSVKEAWDYPQLTIAVNVIGTLNLWQAVVQPELQQFIYISSSEVYGETSHERLTEDHPLTPMNPYAVSKAAAEQLLQMTVQQHPATRLTILRPFNHVGPGQAESFAVPSFARQVLQSERYIFVGNLTAVRDFLDVRDVVDAYCLAVESSTLSGTFNVSSGVGRSLKEVLGDLIRLAGRQHLVIVPDPARYRPLEALSIIGNSERFQRATGWTPRWLWDDTLRDILATLKA